MGRQTVRKRGGESNAERTAPTALRTVARVVEVLELVTGRSGGFAISEIASLLRMPVSSAHALVRRLVVLDYLRRRPVERRYQAGPRLIRLGIRVTGNLEVMSVASPLISDLAARTGEDVYLCLVEDRGVIYAERAMGCQSLRLDIALGTPRPLHATAVGKLYLAMLEESELRTRLRRLALERYTSKTLTEPSALSRELNVIRRVGYAVTNDEHFEGVSAVAAPIRGATGRFLAAVALALPRRRFKERQDGLVQDVLLTANRISEHLGWQRTLVNDRRPRRALRVARAATVTAAPPKT